MPNSLILKYADAPAYYGLAWPGEPWEVRELYTDELDRFLRYYVHEHVQKVLRGSGEGHFTNVFIRPIEVPPGESQVLYGLVCTGSRAEVEQRSGRVCPRRRATRSVYQRAAPGRSRLEPAAGGRRLPLQPGAHGRHRADQRRLPGLHPAQLHPPLHPRASGGTACIPGTPASSAWACWSSTSSGRSTA